MLVVDRLDRLDGIEQEGICAIGPGCCPIGEDDVLDGYRITGAELGIAQLEGVDALVFGDLPGLGEPGDDALARRIRLDQSVANLLDGPDRAVVGGDEGGRGSRARQAERRSGRRPSWGSRPRRRNRRPSGSPEFRPETHSAAGSVRSLSAGCHIGVVTSSVLPVGFDCCKAAPPWPSGRSDRPLGQADYAGNGDFAYGDASAVSQMPTVTTIDESCWQTNGCFTHAEEPQRLKRMT